MSPRTILFTLALSVATACQNSTSKDEAENTFQEGRSLGTNRNENLEEASGLVASANNPGYLWSLNDSGHPAELFLLDTLARTEKVFTLSKIHNRDWEDIALGDCPDQNSPCLFIGDIGDNGAKYPFKYIYRIKEPKKADPELIEEIDTLIVKLDDGMRDTEALMFDPVSKNLYLVSKREKEVRLYEIVNPVPHDTLTAKKILTLDLKEIVAGDISVNGNEVLLKSYLRVYYWKRKNNESLAELLQRKPAKLPYEAEPIGESIAWARDGSGYYTLGENAKGERAKLFFYRRR